MALFFAARLHLQTRTADGSVALPGAELENTATLSLSLLSITLVPPSTRQCCLNTTLAGRNGCSSLIISTTLDPPPHHFRQRYASTGMSDFLTFNLNFLVSSLSDQSRGADSSFSDISWQNVTHVHSEAMVSYWCSNTVYAVKILMMEEPISKITLQINIPVLSLSLSLLLLLLGALALLTFKHMYCITLNYNARKCYYSFSKEPRHIIYEIRTRRPVEENIYTLE
ncbi:hypothetical protein cypCar_00013852 [Cyprinus carpio]|nr:hypothetical protein cypCar_00013852 [Cyprinus carpio]